MGRLLSPAGLALTRIGSKEGGRILQVASDYVLPTAAPIMTRMWYHAFALFALVPFSDALPILAGIKEVATAQTTEVATAQTTADAQKVIGAVPVDPEGAKRSGAVPLPECAECFGYIVATDERKAFMSKQFAQLNPGQPVRIVPPLQMKPEEFDGMIIAKHDEKPAYEDRVFRHAYSKSELSEILTAKTFFANASAHGLPYAVLLEDDIVLTENWVERIREETALAPHDWDVLQFFTNSLPVRNALANVCEPFVHWMPEYWGAALNVVSPRGMAKLAARKITVKESPVVIDYWLYAGLNAYTHTRNMFGEHMFKTRMQHGTFNQLPGFPAPVPCTPTSRSMPPIAAFTVTKQNELSVASLMDHAPKSLEAWVFTVDQTLPPALTSPNLHTATCKTGAAQWVSKWSCLAQHRSTFLNGHFEFVFAFDDDLDFSAFPWRTVWSRIASSAPMVVGFPRESDWGNKEGDFSGRYEGELMLRDFFISQNGDFWRNRTCGKGVHRDTGAFGEMCDARWEGQHAPTQQHLLMPMKFIETGSNLISAPFLDWYLREANDFIEYMDNSGVDWGFDHMWCGAATSYLKTQAQHSTDDGPHAHPCGMVPLPVWHKDSASLTGHYTSGGKAGGRNYKDVGLEQLGWLHKHSAKFAGWLEHSEWQRTMLGKANVWEFRDDVSLEQIVKVSSRAEMDAFRKPPPPPQQKVPTAPIAAVDASKAAPRPPHEDEKQINREEVEQPEPGRSFSSGIMPRHHQHRKNARSRHRKQ